jgi:DNA-binding transcriptional regulator LsrR (DeoR family)
MKRKQREVSMRKIKEMLRLHHVNGLSQRKIAISLSLSVGVVNKYLGLCREAGISWPLPEELREE